MFRFRAAPVVTPALVSHAFLAMTAGQESVREAPNRTPPDLTPAETRRPRAELDSKRALGTATTWCTRPPPNCRRSMTGPACSTASSPGSATPWSRRDVTPKRGSQNRSAGKPEPLRRLNTPWLGAKLARPRKSRLVMVSRGGPPASSAGPFRLFGSVVVSTDGPASGSGGRRVPQLRAGWCCSWERECASSPEKCL